MLSSIPDLLKEAGKSVRRVSMQEASAELAANQGLVIDVREPAEYESNGVPNATNIPRGLLEMKMMELEKDPARPIYLHCATSARAVLSAEQLARVGYTQVSVITCDVETIKKAAM